MPATIVLSDVKFPTTPIDEYQRIVEAEEHSRIHLLIDALSTDSDITGAALVRIEAIDENGLRIPIPGWQHLSNRVNEFEYLTPGDQEIPATTHIVVDVPKGASSVRFTGHRWKQATETHVVGNPILYIEGDPNTPTLSTTGAAVHWEGAQLNLSFPISPGATQISGHVYAKGHTSGTSPLVVTLFDSAGKELMPPEGLPVNPRLGAFISVALGEKNSVRTDFTFPLPEEAVELKLSGVDWGPKTATYTNPPKLDYDGNADAQSIFEFIKPAADDEHLIIIDTTAPPLGHKTLALRPNNLALEYAKLGAKVLFVPFGSLQEQPSIVSHNCGQVARAQLDSVLNELLEGPQHKRTTYICSSFPSLECVARMERANSVGWETLYEIRDDMEEFNRVGYSKWYHPLLESRMLAVADTVVTVSRALAEKATDMARPHRAPHVIPNGVNQLTLEQSVHLRQDVQPEARGSHPKVGYVGHLTDSWFDWPAVILAAEKLPDVSFEIVGHGMPKGINLPDNIAYLGPRTHEEILELVPTWKVGLIPFSDSPLTRGVDPNKIYEYFAWGLRVVSARMGSVDAYPSTWVYSGPDELATSVREAIQTPMSQREIAEIREFAERSSWRERAKSMSKLMKEASR